MKTTRVKPSLCPLCGHMLSAASSITNPRAAPKPGDTTVCISCALVFVFELDMTIRPMNEEELAALTPRQRRELGRTVMAVNMVKQHVNDRAAQNTKH